MNGTVALGSVINDVSHAGGYLTYVFETDKHARGEYLPRSLRPKRRVTDATSPARVASTGRWPADEFHRPGFAPETTKYTSMKGN